LFVCFGNIIRSPMCEALMNRECATVIDAPIINSAGLNAISGKPAHPWAVAAAKEFGIFLEPHRARLLTRAMVDEAGLIFTMDYQNQVQMLSRYPAAKNKTFLLSTYAENKCSEIADPYYSDQEGTRRCFLTLTTCIHNLARSLHLKPDSSVRISGER
jgi:protein-tyrosine-phosphatase